MNPLNFSASSSSILIAKPVDLSYESTLIFDSVLAVDF